MRSSMHIRLALAVAFALCSAAPSAAHPFQPNVRALLQTPDSDGWMDGRATWFEHPWTGSCGYGQLDGATFGLDAVAAMPDVSPDFPGSCGRCFEIKCRGIQAISAEGSVNLDRTDACSSTNTSIIIKIVDTCPCNGNEKWCCGDMPHLDLSKGAFARLAPVGKGIIGLKFRPVPCSALTSTPGPADFDEMKNAIQMGASLDVFTNGDLGIGWAKSVYGDAKKAMYSYDNSLQKFDDGSTALCNTYDMYGGFDFHSKKEDGISTFVGAKGVEFYAKSSNSPWPDMSFRVSNRMRGSCNKDIKLVEGATQETVNGWTKFYFDIASFDCTGGVQIADLDRVQWESKQSGADLCVKDLRIVSQQETPVSSAGRRLL